MAACSYCFVCGRTANPNPLGCNIDCLNDSPELETADLMKREDHR